MGACNNQHFSGVTLESWKCIIDTIDKKFGIEITTPSGTKTKDGFTFKWNYVQKDETLDIQCTDSPAIVPCSLIHDEVTKVVHGCLPDAAALASERPAEADEA